MSEQTNTTPKAPSGKNKSNVTVSSTRLLREFLLSRNLESSYLHDNNPIQPFFGEQKPGGVKIQQFYDKSVIDQDTVEEGGLPQQNSLYLDNKYGPEGGYSDVQTINVDKLLRDNVLEYLEGNTLTPRGYTVSCYNAYDILNEVNISNGIITIMNSNVLNDSQLIQTSSGYLRKSLGENQKQSLLFEGPQATSISASPGKTFLKDDDYLSRLSGVDVNYSEIGSMYFGQQFVPDITHLITNGYSYSGVFGNIQATANALGNFLSNGNNIPANNTSVPSPSNNLINHMGFSQQSQLFTRGLNLNKYRPDYTRVPLRGGLQAVIPYYYVGSSSAEPGTIESPEGATPTDEFGRNTRSLVYGPSAVAKELETVSGAPLWKHYLFGLNGSTYMDGGGLAAGFTWFGHTSFASLNAPMGMLYSRSFNKPKRRGGILDQTQKLIDSAPLMGGARRKHAGHAIDQTSKVFNDGYKDISKGSGARFIDGGLFGVSTTEFCRTWTKDNPYYTFTNLQKSGGLARGNKDSILTNTFNLNIGPSIGSNVDKNMSGQKNAKKYMFSIENLAWRGSPELDKLPRAERGANGGRVMWFPPYDISVSDTNSAQWSPTTFLGRTEPIYTYNSSERIGSLSFKIVVDHPSVLNLIVDNELKNAPDQTADKIIESFFAGCREFDIYELASRYGDLASAVELEHITNTISEVDSTIVETNEDSTDVDEEAGGGTAVDEGATTSDIDEIANNTTEQGSTQGKIDVRRVLQSLMSEGNYFKHLEEHEEFVYASLKRKLKYFHPAFHSMTPEGLNSRLTFLLQCTRPGHTIPVVDKNGEAIEGKHVENTAFGSPPVCILRIGDFYHTKIAIDNMSVSYEPLIFDLNPEGIGVQPMIADVQMNFKFIGGQGLKEPISRLQNALSNNFFANTEVYSPDSVTSNGSDLELESDEALEAINSAVYDDVIGQLNSDDGGSSGEVTT